MNQETKQSLESIYCEGELLHAVQTSCIFDDSKHFVDMVLNYEPQVFYFILSYI
jgi:hypothetical protein